MENLFFDKRDLKYCGKDVIIGKTVRIRKPQEVVIGDNVIIDDFTYIPCALEVGSYTHIGASCSMIGGSGKIKIGSFVNIAPSCQLVTGSNDYKGGGLVGPAIPAEYTGEAIIKPIIISDFVLLACNTTVLPGAVLPEGMATGAFSLVSEQEYQEWSLYVGIPCRFHSPRSGEEMKRTAARLLEDRYSAYRLGRTRHKDNAAWFAPPPRTMRRGLPPPPRTTDLYTHKRHSPFDSRTLITSLKENLAVSLVKT